MFYVRQEWNVRQAALETPSAPQPEIEFTSEPHTLPVAAFNNILDVEAALSAEAKD